VRFTEKKVIVTTKNPPDHSGVEGAKPTLVMLEHRLSFRQLPALPCHQYSAVAPGLAFSGEGQAAVVRGRGAVRGGEDSGGGG